MADRTDSGEFTTVLGPDVSIKGELSFEKAVRLQGKFEGEVKTSGLLHVDREASLTGEVKAGNVRVDGSVRGNLTAAGRVELRQTADHEGDLTAGKLVVEEGAVFKGHVSVGPNASKAAGVANQPQLAEEGVNLRNGLHVNN
jgi:cytoskeletal protein CcmA (bactofilin family)